MAYDKSPGTSRLARVISNRVKNEMAAPLSIDFGRIQANGSLLTDTFPVPIPKGEYSVCRHLTLGQEGSDLAQVSGGEHSHNDGTEGGGHTHVMPVPEKMRSIAPGDRVLVAWVQSEAVVVDIVVSSGEAG